MAYATAKELLALKQNDPTRILSHFGVGSIYARDLRDEEHAQLILDSAFTRTINNQHGKGIRPWHIVNVTEKLDPNQPWLGFEYEMGLATKTEYDKLINFVWKNINHCAVDKEGYGTYCPEITFSPENLENYMNGTSAIQRTIKWMNEQGIKMLDFGDYPVGTHLNVSTPAFRALSMVSGQTQNVSNLIACSLLMLTADEHRELFGRVAYGVGQHGEGQWIEFKIFRSTDNLTVLDKYMRLGRYMAELVESVSRLDKIPGYVRYSNRCSYIHNIKDILLGNIPATELDIRSAIVDLPVLGWRSSYHRGPNYGLDYAHYRVSEEKKNAA